MSPSHEIDSINSGGQIRYDIIVEDKFDMTYMYELLRPQPYRGHIYT
jgi:hypothetical protein